MVTGAAQGIGAAIARRFAAQGARLVLLDRSVDQCIDVASQIGATALQVDLADPASTVAATSKAVEVLGGVDVLVNNAGVLHMAPLLEISVDDWDRTFDINVRSMLLTIQTVAPHMISVGGGSIVNMASMGGKQGSPGQAHYAASKAAVISLTRVAAMELGQHRIRVNCICPGYVLTEMGAATRTDEMVAGWSARSPLGRCGEADEVADAALFLASDQSRYCTGDALNVSGGMWMS